MKSHPARNGLLDGLRAALRPFADESAPTRAWRLVATLLCLLPIGAAFAQDGGLQKQVTQLVEQHLPSGSQLTNLDLGQPAARILACAQPQPTLVHPRRLPVGRVALEVRCGADDAVLGYLQVKVAAIGNYIVSTARIGAGQTIDAGMLASRRGPLQDLPSGSALRADQVVGRQAARGVEAGGVVALRAVRERWLVERNSRVSLRAQGAGFSLTRDGKALDNGSLGNTVRFVGNDGRMLEAQVVGKNQLLLRY